MTEDMLDVAARLTAALRARLSEYPSLSEVARELGIGRSTVIRWRHSRGLRARPIPRNSGYRGPRTHYIRPDDLALFLAGLDGRIIESLFKRLIS